MAGTTGLEPATSDVKGQQSVRNSENLCPRKLRGEPTGSSFGKGESDEPCKDRRKARPGRLPTHEGQFWRRLTSSGGVPDRQHDIWLAGRRAPARGRVGAVVGDHRGYHSAGCPRDDACASLSAQTCLGGVLGGNLAFYTMITSKTCL